MYNTSHLYLCIHVHSSKCKYRVDKSSSQCSNKSCSLNCGMYAVSGGGSNPEGFSSEPHFNMLVSLTDCTGTVESVAVTGLAASNLLMCSVSVMHRINVMHAYM